MTSLEGMTQATWNGLNVTQRASIRDLSGLTDQLKGLEGWRVEVTDKYGDTRRFIVGMSTGWRPCHLEVKTRRSMGGMSADREYVSVRAIRKVR